MALLNKISNFLESSSNYRKIENTESAVGKIEEVDKKRGLLSLFRLGYDFKIIVNGKEYYKKVGTYDENVRLFNLLKKNIEKQVFINYKENSDLGEYIIDKIFFLSIGIPKKYNGIEEVKLIDDSR